MQERLVCRGDQPYSEDLGDDGGRVLPGLGVSGRGFQEANKEGK